MTWRTGPVVMIGVVLVVVFAVAGGLRMLRSPGEERAHRRDAQRVQALAVLSRAIDRFAERSGALPESLDALVPTLTTREATRDPEHDEPYGYRVTGERTFELCAEFDAADDSPANGRFWAHDDGRQCYTIEVQPAPRR